MAASAQVRTAERELKAEITGRMDSATRREQAQQRAQELQAADAINDIANRFSTRFGKSPQVNRDLRELERKLRNGEPISEKEASTLFGLSGDPAFALNNLDRITWVPEIRNPDLEIKEMRIGARTAVALARAGTTTVARVALNPNIERQIAQAVRAGEIRAARQASASRARGIPGIKPRTVSRAQQATTRTQLRNAQQKATTARQMLRQAQAELQAARAKGITNPAQVSAVMAASRNLVNAEAQVTAQAVRHTVTVSPQALSGVKPGQTVFVTIQPSATSTPTITITKPAPGGKTVTTRVPRPAPKSGTRTRVEQRQGPAPGPRPRFTPKPTATPAVQPRVGQAPAPTTRATATRTTVRTPARTPATRPLARPVARTPRARPLVVPPPLSFGDRPVSSRTGSRGQPVVLNFRQGALYKRVNLVNGTIKSSRTVPQGGVRAGTTPRQTLKPVRFGAKTRVKKFDTGKFVAEVSGDRISFEEDRGQPAIRERLTP